MIIKKRLSPEDDTKLCIITRKYSRREDPRTAEQRTFQDAGGGCPSGTGWKNEDQEELKLNGDDHWVNNVGALKVKMFIEAHSSKALYGLRLYLHSFCHVFTVCASLNFLHSFLQDQYFRIHYTAMNVKNSHFESVLLLSKPS